VPQPSPAARQSACDLAATWILLPDGASSPKDADHVGSVLLFGRPFAAEKGDPAQQAHRA
jgi:hypothetical protein